MWKHYYEQKHNKQNIINKGNIGYLYGKRQKLGEVQEGTFRLTHDRKAILLHYFIHITLVHLNIIFIVYWNILKQPKKY